MIQFNNIQIEPTDLVNTHKSELWIDVSRHRMMLTHKEGSVFFDKGVQYEEFIVECCYYPLQFNCRFINIAISIQYSLSVGCEITLITGKNAWEHRDKILEQVNRLQDFTYHHSLVDCVKDIKNAQDMDKFLKDNFQDINDHLILHTIWDNVTDFDKGLAKCKRKDKNIVDTINSDWDIIDTKEIDNADAYINDINLTKYWGSEPEHLIQNKWHLFYFVKSRLDYCDVLVLDKDTIGIVNSPLKIKYNKNYHRTNNWELFGAEENPLGYIKFSMLKDKLDLLILNNID